MYNSHSDIWAAGAFAAVLVDFIVYPFDTLKTRIQSPGYERIYKDARTGAVRRDILFRGLYQGVWSVVFATIPSSGAFFTTYEAVKSSLHASSTAPNDSRGFYTHSPTFRVPVQHSLPVPIIHGIASSIAEMVACFILTPAEVLKQNAQIVNSQRATAQSSHRADAAVRQGTAMRQVLSRFRYHPWRLWSGYGALVGRNLPATGLQFPMFEYVRARMISWRRRRKAAHAESPGAPGVGRKSEMKEQLIERAGLTGLSAAMAGVVSSFATTPIDVVKTRVMLAASERYAAGPDGMQKNEGRRGRGTFAVGKDICQNEGVRGLFKGGAIRAGWTAISLSLYLSLYESGRFYLEYRRRRVEQRV
ncbi:hypothetical protein N7492_010247 [Penicillium capsulatum]|uniref:Mitochondrial thiamine pyrophosphate carrier 1 n=1 Tax=Penicillium capsulatum TaxID=69766 RepID=A0A9W9HM27_9EURO|nr:hypothetical protein N7492_010247 [Penicillium capsulatum]KAJ6112754.1 hypothetical protein N7512_008078 [Penicillium capsulatum]